MSNRGRVLFIRERPINVTILKLEDDSVSWQIQDKTLEKRVYGRVDHCELR